MVVHRYTGQHVLAHFDANRTTTPGIDGVVALQAELLRAVEHVVALHFEPSNQRPACYLRAAVVEAESAEELAKRIRATCRRNGVECSCEIEGEADA